MEPYGVSSTGYVTFEDPHSSAVKSRWVKENGYAGIMVWEVSHDYIEGTGNPILDSIAEALRDDQTTAIRPIHKARNIGSAKNAVKVDALGHKIRGKRPIILLDVGGKR